MYIRTQNCMRYGFYEKVIIYMIMIKIHIYIYIYIGSSFFAGSLQIRRLQMTYDSICTKYNNYNNYTLYGTKRILSFIYKSSVTIHERQSSPDNHTKDKCVTQEYYPIYPYVKKKPQKSRIQRCSKKFINNREHLPRINS